ncbi:unnamed protein product [Malus baccata var. baccata]
MLDASAGGALVDKTPTAVNTLIANRALNAQQYEGIGQRSNPRQHQVNEVSAIIKLQNQMANLTTLLSQVVEGPKVQNVAVCGVCATHGHLMDKCPQLIENGGWETLNAVGFGNQYQPRNDPFSNTYNPGWRDHPNFKWREPQQGQQQSTFRQQPLGFYQKLFATTQPKAQPTQTNSGSSIDNDQIFQLLTSMAQGMQNRDKMMDELEKQVGQIAEFMGQFREQGKLPSSTVVNPRGGVETAKAVTLRSGKEVGTEPQPSKSAPKEDEKLQIEEENQAKATARVETPLPQPPKPSNSATIGKEGPIQVNSNVIPPDVPFPSRFLQAKNEEEEKDVLETFRKVHVNIPLLDAIKQIPKYAKFLKKLCTTRKRIREKEVVHVSENVSALLQRKLPPKCKDPDFYVLDMEDSTHSPPSPLLLGRPFMKTAQTKIDVAKGAVTMAFGGDMINFKISESVENTNDVRSCCAINVPNRSQRGGRVRVDLEKQNTTIRKDHYPIPFKDPKNEVFCRAGCGKTPPCRGVP